MRWYPRSAMGGPSSASTSSKNSSAVRVLAGRISARLRASSPRRKVLLRLEAVRTHGGVRVDRVAGTGTHLDVHVRAGGVAGRADAADQLPGADLLAGVDRERGLVAVPELGAVGEGLDGAVAVGPGGGGLRDGPAGDGVDRGARGGGEVQAGVAVRPETGALAEPGGQVVGPAGDRQLPGVPGDQPGLLLRARSELGQGRVALLGLLLRHRLQLLVGGVP